MNKRVVLAVIVFLVLAAGAFAYAFSTSSDGDQGTNLESESEQQVTSSPAGTGKYVDYSDSAVNDAEGEVVLFFHAPWCPQCRAIESDIKSQGVPDGVTIIKVDYDSNQSLRQKYGVTIQTTFVKVDNEGNFIARYVAYDEPSLDSVKRNFL